MYISELRLLGFRCFGGCEPSEDSGCFTKPIVINLEPEITALIGRNGSGKSSCLVALQRLFGETRDERNLRSDDFYVKPGETLESHARRELYIEALILFPELEGGEKAAQNTIPEYFKHFFVDEPGGKPCVRIRLEGTWESSTTLEGTVEENIYWIVSSEDFPLGDADGKIKMSQSNRANIVVKYIPASRDVYSMTRLALGSFGKSLMQSIIWKNKTEIQDNIEIIGEKINSESAFAKINQVINRCWNALHAADTETNACLSIFPQDFQQILKTATIVFEPSATGRRLGLENLSDGQRSLFHFVLVKSLLELRLSLESELNNGVTLPFSSSFAKAPVLSIFAFEEPENHLAPYFLSRLMMELHQLTGTHRVQGFVTSHSPSIVGRLEPTALRYMNRDSNSGVSSGCKLQLPHDDEDAAKFVREAVKAHPEIYFAKHAIFGEGASEEIVIPKLAEALGVPIDRSFVAIVPIGGRYITHFWRLTSQLGIPQTTLMDFDLGRSSGDIAQLKIAADAVLKCFQPTDRNDVKNLKFIIKEKRSRCCGENDYWDFEVFKEWMEWFEKFGIYFSFPLDLDMMMLEAFPDAYMELPPDRKGPQQAEEQNRQVGACKVAVGEGVGAFGSTPYTGGTYMKLFPWYTYLFLGDRGKPAVHLSAISRLTPEKIQESCPDVYRRLIEKVKNSLQ